MQRVPSKQRALRLATLDGASTEPPQTGKRWRGYDAVFFNPDQIRVDTRLRYFGALDHGALWKVVEIKGYKNAHSVRGRVRPSGVVQRVSDRVTLLRVGTNETRVMSFIYLRYSSIWRLA